MLTHVYRMKVLYTQNFFIPVLSQLPLQPSLAHSAPSLINLYKRHFHYFVLAMPRVSEKRRLIQWYQKVN